MTSSCIAAPAARKPTPCRREIVAKGRTRASCSSTSPIAPRAAAALEADVGEHGAYYGVVCNAGLTRDGAFPGLTSDDWDQVLRTNLDGFYNVLHPLVMPMIRRRKPGRIVCITSVSGMIGNRGQVNYSASKAGVIGAAKALAVEAGQAQDHRELRGTGPDRHGHARRPRCRSNRS